jgi:hypothetical protein
VPCALYAVSFHNDAEGQSFLDSIDTFLGTDLDTRLRGTKVRLLYRSRSETAALSRAKLLRARGGWKKLNSCLSSFSDMPTTLGSEIGSKRTGPWQLPTGIQSSCADQALQPILNRGLRERRLNLAVGYGEIVRSVRARCLMGIEEIFSWRTVNHLIGITDFCGNFWEDPDHNERKRNRFLYRFCTADSAFEPFLVFLLFGESITYMLSTLLHSSIPTSSTKF